MKEKFIKEMAEILKVDIESLAYEKRFDEIGASWDSLAIVSTITTIDEIFDIVVSGSEVTNCNSIQEIIEVVENSK